MKRNALLLVLIVSLLSFKTNTTVTSHKYSYTFNLEDDVEEALKKEGIVYIRDQKFGPNGSLGEIDFQVEKAIIEVTETNSGKLKKVTKLLTNTTINPDGKPVILFAPNYTNTSSVAAIKKAGATVLWELEDLINLID